MSERQKYNKMWMSKQLGNKVLSISNLSELNEKKKHQIRIEKSKMKSQELRYQRQRVNQLYAKDQGKVFRKFREAIKRDIDYLAVRFNPPKEIRSNQNICLTKIAILYVDD